MSDDSEAIGEATLTAGDRVAVVPILSGADDCLCTVSVPAGFLRADETLHVRYAFNPVRRA